MYKLNLMDTELVQISTNAAREVTIAPTFAPTNPARTAARVNQVSKLAKSTYHRTITIFLCIRSKR